MLPTPIGKTAANYYMRHETAALYDHELHESMDTQELLGLLVRAEVGMSRDVVGVLENNRETRRT
jgi:hypothetical protein